MTRFFNKYYVCVLYEMLTVFNIRNYCVLKNCKLSNFVTAVLIFDIFGLLLIIMSVTRVSYQTRVLRTNLHYRLLCVRSTSILQQEA